MQSSLPSTLQHLLIYEDPVSGQLVNRSGSDRCEQARKHGIRTCITDTAPCLQRLHPAKEGARKLSTPSAWPYRERQYDCAQLEPTNHHGRTTWQRRDRASWAMSGRLCGPAVCYAPDAAVSANGRNCFPAAAETSDVPRGASTTKTPDCHSIEQIPSADLYTFVPYGMQHRHCGEKTTAIACAFPVDVAWQNTIQPLPDHASSAHSLRLAHGDRRSPLAFSHGSATSTHSCQALPVGSKRSKTVIQRASRACDRCRRQKTRCEPVAKDGPGACKRCTCNGKECSFFVPQKKRGPLPKRAPELRGTSGDYQLQ